MIQTLQDRRHFLDVCFFFLEFEVLFVIFNVFSKSVAELLLVFSAPHVAVCHDSHYLLVVVEDA